MSCLDFILLSLCISFTVIFSSLIAAGFYSACGFGYDENFDKAPKLMKKNWPKPGDDDEDKMILWWVRFYIGKHITYYLSKPLYSCIICMGSVHSIIPTALFCYLTNTTPFIWPIVAFLTVGLNTHISVWWKK